MYITYTQYTEIKKFCRKYFSKRYKNNKTSYRSIYSAASFDSKRPIYSIIYTVYIIYYTNISMQCVSAACCVMSLTTIATNNHDIITTYTSCENCIDRLYLFV